LPAVNVSGVVKLFDLLNALEKLFVPSEGPSLGTSYHRPLQLERLESTTLRLVPTQTNIAALAEPSGVLSCQPTVT
jgi:hypothetical protein